MLTQQLITGLGNLFPKTHVEVWRRWHAGDLKGAQELQKLLAPADTANVKLGTCELPGFEQLFFDLRSKLMNRAAGLKSAVKRYYGYGSQVVRSPLPSNGDQKLKAEWPIPIFEKLHQVEESL